MIIGKVENFEQFEALHPRFPAAFAFAKELIANGFKPGRNDMATPNNEIYANGNIYVTRTMDKAVMEVHYEYIDIQIMVEGQEQLYVPGLQTREQDHSYTGGGDCELFFMPDPNTCSRATVQAGDFVIFMPNEQHCPNMAINDEPSNVRKIVMKVLY
ncbi:MAG: YhcH/YjgK/YiaL family protein [Clostridia bacterium]|nr:YhcH/YjgK/YiaL family protein [Clostridia bacterium]MBR2927363.1 YhcH/YjgK/YiaL family protein [Clostridia bacterium]